MAQQTLTFAAEGGKYKAAWTSAGAAVVQLQRSAPGGVEVRAHLEGMDPLVIAKDYPGTPQKLIMQVDVPAGVVVEIVSDTPVTSAAMLDGSEGEGA